MPKYISTDQLIVAEFETTNGLVVKPTKGYGIKTTSVNKKNTLVQLNENDGERLMGTNLMDGVTSIDGNISAYGNINILGMFLPTILGQATKVGNKTTYDIVNGQKTHKTITLEVEKGLHVGRYSGVETSNIALTSKAGEDSSVGVVITILGRKGSEVEKIKSITNSDVEFFDDQTFVVGDKVDFLKDDNTIATTTPGGVALSGITVATKLTDRVFTFSKKPNVGDNCILNKTTLLTVNKYIRKNPLQLKSSNIIIDGVNLTGVKDYNITFDAQKQKLYTAGSNGVSDIYEKGLSISGSLTVDGGSSEALISKALSKTTVAMSVLISDDYGNSLIIALNAKLETNTDLALNDLITTNIKFKTVSIQEVSIVGL